MSDETKVNGHDADEDMDNDDDGLELLPLASFGLDMDDEGNVVIVTATNIPGDVKGYYASPESAMRFGQALIKAAKQAKEDKPQIVLPEGYNKLLVN